MFRSPPLLPSSGCSTRIRIKYELPFVLSASAAKERRTAFSLVIMRRVVVIYYRPCETFICPATSVIDYHQSLRNNPEERSY